MVEYLLKWSYVLCLLIMMNLVKKFFAFVYSSPDPTSWSLVFNCFSPCDARIVCATMRRKQSRDVEKGISDSPSKHVLCFLSPQNTHGWHLSKRSQCIVAFVNVIFLLRRRRRRRRETIQHQSTWRSKERILHLLFPTDRRSHDSRDLKNWRWAISVVTTTRSGWCLGWSALYMDLYKMFLAITYRSAHPNEFIEEPIQDTVPGEQGPRTKSSSNI